MNRPWSSILSEEKLSPNSLVGWVKDAGCIRVPKYQRPYSWGEDEVVLLLTDIKTAGIKKRSWFLGMIYWQSDLDAKGPRILLDGQQRMTTFFLFLICLRAHLAQNSVVIEGKVWSKWSVLISYCFGYVDDDGDYQCKLDVDGDWSVIFEDEDMLNMIKSPERIPTKVRDEENWEEVFKNLTEYKRQMDLTASGFSMRSAASNLDVIRNWLVENVSTKDEIVGFLSGLLDYLWILDIPLKDSESAKLLFEGINSRGLSLDIIDKLRFRMLTDDCWSNSGIKGGAENVSKMWGGVFEHMQPSVSVGLGDGESLLELYLRGDLESEDVSLPSNMRDHEGWWDVLCKRRFQDDGSLSGDKMIAWLEEFALFLRLWNWVVREVEPAPAKVPYVDVKKWSGNLALRKRNKLFGLVRQGLSISENFKWFIAGVLVKCIRSGVPSDFVGLLFHGVKRVYIDEVIENRPSNAMRTSMFGYVADTATLEVSLTALKNNPLSLSKRGLCGKNDDARFVLLFSSWFVEDDWAVLEDNLRYPVLVDGIGTTKAPHVDHFCPLAWSKHWPYADTNASLQDLRKWLLTSVEQSPLDYLSWSLVNEEYQHKVHESEYDLKKGAKAKVVHAFNWLGNKWVLDDIHNRRKNHKGLAQAKEYYQGRSSVAGPTHGYAVPAKGDIGWSVFLKGKSEWTVSDVLNRTVGIHALIFSRLEWDIADCPD